MDLFNNEALLYEGRKSELTVEQIRGLFNDEFSGIEDFIRLYQTFDGVCFTKLGVLARHKFYDVPRSEIDEISMSGFFKFDNIVNTMAIEREEGHEFQSFYLTHVPFSDDGCGNSIYIEVPTGLIKMLDHEEEDLEEAVTLVAPGFKEFCLALVKDEDFPTELHFV